MAVRRPTPRQNVIRILFILVRGATPTSPAQPDVAAIFRGEAKLHALDFWVRNPDYLAHEVLDRYERTRDPALLETAGAIFADEEPDLRRIP